ncbi:MAG: amidohydrolase family protein, partial [Gammaproteobacteria bacterium]
MKASRVRTLSLVTGAVIWQLMTPAQTAELLIEDVTVIDGTGRPAQPGSWVLVRDGRFVAVTQAPLKANEQVERIDGSGKYLIPGLIDVHVHIPGGRGIGPRFDQEAGVRSLHSYLYSGVTSIYDAGNNPRYIMPLRKDERAGKLLSPRIFATGSGVSYPGSWGGGPAALVVDAWPEGASRLDQNFARQPDLQKITYENFGTGANAWVPSFTPELFTEIVKYCREKGIRTTVHISDEAHARVALEAGVDTLAHGVMVGRMSDSFVSMLANSGVVVTTSLAVFENIAQIVDDPSFLDQPALRAVMDPGEITTLKTRSRQLYAEMGWGAWFKAILPYAKGNVRRLHEAGGVLALGTDRNLGPLTQRELGLIVEAGIPPLAALRIGTLNAAVFLGQEDDLGSIEPGKYADMVLLDADPLTDISNVARISAVF